MSNWVSITQLVPSTYIDDANNHAHATGTDADAGTYGRGIIWDHPNLPLECHLSSQLMKPEDVDNMLAGIIPSNANENADKTKAKSHLNRLIVWRPLEGEAMPKLVGTKVFVLILPSGVDVLPYLNEIGIVRRESATI